MVITVHTTTTHNNAFRDSRRAAADISVFRPPRPAAGTVQCGQRGGTRRIRLWLVWNPPIGRTGAMIAVHGIPIALTSTTFAIILLPLHNHGGSLVVTRRRVLGSSYARRWSSGRDIARHHNRGYFGPWPEIRLTYRLADIF